MAKEKKSWEDDATSVIDEEQKPAAPAAVAPGPLAEKASESSTLRGSTADRHDGDTNVTNQMTEQKHVANLNGGGISSKPSEGTTL
jgi:hypothetical protein